jgi:hypothetical protein
MNGKLLKFEHDFQAEKTLLLIKQWRKYVLNEILFGHFCPLGRASMAMSCRALRNVVIITFLVEIHCLSFGITSPNWRAKIESNSIR